jgi:UMF1 family MFS transporter
MASKDKDLADTALRNKAKWGWIFYDWANSAFSTTVMSAFFPIFFSQYYSAGSDPVLSTARMGDANSICALAVVLSVPFFGALADRGGHKKKFLLMCVLLGVSFIAALTFVPKGAWLWGILCYIVAFFFHSAANAFYDALLPEVANETEIDMVSSQGYAFGYLGGGLLFVLNILMYVKPTLFGLADGISAVRLSYFTVAVWWLAFTIPLLIFVKEKPSKHQNTLSMPAQIKSAFSSLVSLFKELGGMKPTLLFLIAFFLYNDGVGTIIKMSGDYGVKIGLQNSDLLIALAVVQFVGFPCALVFGKLAQRYHPKLGIFIGIVVYTCTVVWAYQMQFAWEFYALAVAIGFVQGPVQALSRSFYSRLIPIERAGEFYGLYNMLGRFIGILGPWMIARVVTVTGDHRSSILSIALLFIAGGALLLMVDEKKAKLIVERMRK